MFSPAWSSELLVEQLIVAQCATFVSVFLKWVINCYSSETAFSPAISATEIGELSGAEACVSFSALDGLSSSLPLQSGVGHLRPIFPILLSSVT